jgi:hypothetical protein
LFKAYRGFIDEHEYFHEDFRHGFYFDGCY